MEAGGHVKRKGSIMKQLLTYQVVIWVGVFLWSPTGGVPLASCGFIPPPTYSAEAIEAWVVDEDTGQPLEGVIVVAHWELMGGLHPDTIGQLMVMEAVTDTNGRFHFPKWGPKLRPVSGFLHNDDPQLILFKSGYHYSILANEVTSEVNTSSVRRSEWNQQTIKLKKFTNHLQEYGGNIHYIEENLRFAFNSKSCEWKRIPRMLIALDQEKTRLLRMVDKKYETVEHAGITYWDKSFSPANVQRCGLMKEFLRSYLQ
jgi:hypothetical protein